MYCDYCGQENSDSAYRCARCRTRLDQPAAQGVVRERVLTAAAVPKQASQPEPEPAPQLRTHQGGGPALAPGTRPMRQQRLFPEAVLPVARLETYTPIRSRTRAPEAFAELKRKAPGRPVSELQSSFDYETPGPNTALRRATAFAGSRAPWPVLLAGTVTDAAIVGLFAALTVLVARQALVWMTGVAPGAVSLTEAACCIFVVALVYKALWAMFGKVTPGLQAVGIDLVGFDGRSPSFVQRMVRVLVGWLGTATLGLDVIYSFVDRKGLCWHDDASQSYHTFRSDSGRYKDRE